MNESNSGRIRVSLQQAISLFNEAIEAAEVFPFAARSSRLQLEQCLTLDLHLENATNLKREAVRRQEEGHANLFLGFECAIGALRSELLMWLLLKQESPSEAWDQFVAAQMGYLDATRADSGFDNCNARLASLTNIESALFPPQVFVSAGFVSDRIECSICGERYSKCSHLRGKPYMGRFCEVIHRNPRGDHIAIVDTPADKRCRVVSFKTEHGNRDKLTWEISPYEAEEEFRDRGAHVSFLTFDRYPYLKPTRDALGERINALQSAKPSSEPDWPGQRD